MRWRWNHENMMNAWWGITDVSATNREERRSWITIVLPRFLRFMTHIEKVMMVMSFRSFCVVDGY